MKIYLFGSTGMVGKYVHTLLKSEYIIECINKNTYDIFEDNEKKLETLFKEISCKDVIINCAGIVPQTNKSDKKEYIKVNSIFPHTLENIALNKNVKCIHITTDCVFSGKEGGYTENDISNETNIYGITKSLGEPENICVIRTSFIGHEIDKINSKGLLEWVVSNKNGKLNGYTNHLWNGITCLTLSKIIKKIIINNLYWNGCRHIFSPSNVTKYELCKYINEIYSLNIDINKYKTDLKIDRTLKSIYNTNNLFNNDSIFKQICEQKKELDLC